MSDLRASANKRYDAAGLGRRDHCHLRARKGGPERTVQGKDVGLVER